MWFGGTIGLHVSSHARTCAKLKQIQLDMCAAWTMLSLFTFFRKSSEEVAEAREVLQNKSNFLEVFLAVSKRRTCLLSRDPKRLLEKGHVG